MAPGGAPELPGEPQESPKRAPGGPQEGPKRAPRRPKRAPRGPQDPPKSPKRSPRCPKRAPRGPQDPPKEPHSSKKASDAPRWPPRWLNTLLPLLSLGCFGGGRGGLEGPFSLKMAPRGPPMLQDGLQDGSRQRKIAQDGFQHASKMPQEGHKTVPSALGAPSGPPKNPKSFKNRKKMYDFCLLAVSLPMRFGDLKMTPRWPKKAPRGAQEAPKTAPRAPKSAPREPQEGPKRRF